MPAHEELREKAVAAVLDEGMTQVAVCELYEISRYRLGKWLRDERDHRAQVADEPELPKLESNDERILRIARQWKHPELYAIEIKSRLKAAKRGRFFCRYVLCGPIWVLFGIVWLIVFVIAAALAIAWLHGSSNWWWNIGISLSIILTFGFFHASLWLFTQYLVNLVFRRAAPYAYVAIKLQGALQELGEVGVGIYQYPAVLEEEETRTQIIEKIAWAASILDTTWRRGRSISSPTARENERSARRKVAVHLAKAEELLWERDFEGWRQAREIVEVALYQTLLRRWSLHKSEDADNVTPPNPLQRRWLPALLRGLYTAGVAIASFMWQVLAPEDQTPAHFIRAFLQSQHLLGP
jgi:transposase-like protein